MFFLRTTSTTGVVCRRPGALLFDEPLGLLNGQAQIRLFKAAEPEMALLSGQAA